MKKNHIRLLFFCLVSALFATACETQMVTPIDLDALEQGGYIRTVSPYPVSSTTFNYSIAGLSSAKMEFVAEAVTPQSGALFSSYELSIQFVDNTASNGTKTTTAKALKTLQASSFTKDATTGYPRATISVTAAEALTATGLTAADIANGDRFQVTGVMKLTNGKSFTAANTGLNITGGAFYSSPFSYRINVIP